MGAIVPHRGQRAAIASTSRRVRPLRRRHSSRGEVLAGRQGPDEDDGGAEALDLAWPWTALRPATIELMPVTVMMPMTTPRMVRPARIL